MQNEKLVHDLIADNLKQKFSRDYKEIKINPAGSPDIVLLNHGMVLGNVEVETDSTITSEKAEEWKALAEPGIKLFLVVPKHAKVKVTDLLWEKGIMDRVSVGTYEIVINMP